MKTFEYRGFTRAGHATRGIVEALGVKDARERLSEQGILAERVFPTGRKTAFPAERRATVYRELSALLAAGMPILKAFDILIDSPELVGVRVLLAGVRDSVREGAALADALESASHAVTPFEKAVIHAAERSGNVESMLESLGAFVEEREQLRHRVQGALIYPTIVLGVGICVALVMLGVLVPRAREILSGSSIPLPRLTAFTIAFGQWLLHWGVLILVVAIGGAFFFARRLRREEGFRQRWDRRVFTVPLLGAGYTLLVNLRFARTLAILLRGGVSLIEGLLLAGRATGSAWVAELARTQAEAVRHGLSLSAAVREIPPLATVLPGWIQVGEASGGLEKLLEGAGQRFQQQWERYVGRCLSVLEPVLVLCVGGFVLLITLSVLLPVLSLTHAVSR